MGISTKVFCTSDLNLVIQLEGVMSYGVEKLRADAHKDMQATTIPEGPN